MPITKEKIIQALSTVEEPDLKKDLVTLNMIQNVETDGTHVTFTVVLTTPACPLKEKIRKDCEEALYKVDPDLEIKIEMTAEVTTARKTAVLQGVKNVIAVSSGKGGVGKSTVTANLALALAQTGASVGLIDADIFGPSIPTMFGLEKNKPMVEEINGKQMILPIEKFGIKIISMGFLSPTEGAVVWRGPMASRALTQFIGDVKWGELDYLLFDMPPGTSDIHLTLTGAVPLTGAVIVTTPQKVALADAIKGIEMYKLPQINVPILGVIENMAYFTPAELPDNKYYIFGQDGGKVLAEKYSVTFLGEVPLVQDIRESGDRGIPMVSDVNDPAAASFIKIAEKLAQKIAITNASKLK